MTCERSADERTLSRPPIGETLCVLRVACRVRQFSGDPPVGRFAVNKPVCYFVSLPVVALLLTSFSASAATAQGAAAPPATDEVKVLVDNDKVVVTEEKLRRGAESASKARPYRVVRALEGGASRPSQLGGRITQEPLVTESYRMAVAGRVVFFRIPRA
ncbi:hypothetical protein B0G76_7868 [Paraburkholderia sp. BL23I1N1]|nr:hypothetical protein B0G76_7868 [Paraburkholderia sp. BL23I1N1]